MFTYTKQQLQGGGRYVPKCKLGNWQEDLVIDSLMLKDFLDRKERGELKLDAYNRKLARGLQPVDLNKGGDDGYLRFGDVVMLRSGPGGSLACCADDVDPRPGVNSVGASVSPLEEPVARTTFCLVRVEARPGSLDSTVRYDDDAPLHYGQKFRLMANPAACSDPAAPPMFLKSCPVSLQHFAKFSRHLEVSFTFNQTADTVWTVLTPDPAKQLVSLGVPVMAGAPVLLQHVNTKTALAVEKHKFSNDFGQEQEVAGYNYTGHKHLYSLDADKQGKPPGLATKGCTESNVWIFM